MSTLLSPRAWGAHLLMVAAVAAAIGLGFWQLGAWQAHRAAESRDLTGLAPVPLSSVMTGDSVLTGDDLGRPVSFSGSWLPAGTLYVSDRDQGGKRGFWVMTPVRVGSSAMPVVRGWSPTASAPQPEGRVEVSGWLQASEGSGAADPDPEDDVIPEMRIASVVQHVDADLYGAFVVSRTPTDGLTAVTPDAIPEVSNLSGLRNLLYALQWWVFAGFAVYVWQRWCRDQLELAEVLEAPEQQVASDA